MNKIVKISVVASNGVVINNYSMEYNNANELNGLIQEAREVWSEYFIEAETDLFTQSFSHTYSQEVLMNNK
jgi:hypothetical protein